MARPVPVASAVTPPIYTGSGGRDNLARFRQQPLPFLREIGRQGEVVQFRLGWIQCYLVTQPAAIQQVFASDMTRESPGFRRIRHAVGRGLLTLTGKAHHERRRLMQPAFSHRTVQQWGESMVQQTVQMLSTWHSGQERDLEADMLALTFRNLGQVLFGAAMERDTLQAAFATLNAYVNDRQGLLLVPPVIPTPANRRFRQAQRVLDREIARLIDLHQQEPARYEGDILSFLLHAQTPDGRPLSRDEIRTEVRTLVPAGHETTTSLLTWVWYLLSQEPEVEQRLHAELDQVLHGRLPTVADLPQLPYTRMVLHETLRLYPPICFIGRKTTRDTIIGGYRLAKNAVVCVSPWVTHADPGVWEQPQQCDPERFAPDRAAHRSRFAYFPFGGGAYTCIGEPLALLEGHLILATIAQRYRLTVRLQHEVAFTLVPSLRPRNGMPMMVTKRESPG